MTFRPVTVHLWGSPSTYEPLEWEWVDGQLTDAGTYWLVTAAPGEFPHPRPVWGVWVGERLLLTVGSPRLSRHLAADPRVAVHLDSGTDVVIVEGTAGSPRRGYRDRFLSTYEAKYRQPYDISEVGPPTAVEPTAVIGYRTAGWAGQDGFRSSGKWVPAGS